MTALRKKYGGMAEAVFLLIESIFGVYETSDFDEKIVNISDKLPSLSVNIEMWSSLP
jgi:hypothetical protein